jgi:PAS domain S-box-containing protein
MQKRGHFIPPRTVTYQLGNDVIPIEIFNQAEDLESTMDPYPGTRVQHQDSAVVDSTRRFVEVSDSFCKLLGYKRHELIGKAYDEITAPNTADIATTYYLFARFGYMHGLWMFTSRNGDNLLVRYEAWIRLDHHIQSVMELVA